MFRSVMFRKDSYTKRKTNSSCFLRLEEVALIVLLVTTSMSSELGKESLYTTGKMATIALFTGTFIQVSGFRFVILEKEWLQAFSACFS